MSDLRERLRGEGIEWAKTIGAAFLAYLAFTTVAFAQYRIPSESMVPHIEVGDRVTVSKFAYGYSRFSLPFDIGFALPRSEHRIFESMPQRGDVVDRMVEDVLRRIRPLLREAAPRPAAPVHQPAAGHMRHFERRQVDREASAGGLGQCLGR